MDETNLWERFRRGLVKIATSVSYAWLLLILAVPFLTFLYLKSTQPPYSQQGQEHPVGWGGLPIDYVSLQWWAIISSAMFFGALGSTVSFFSRQDLSPAEVSKTRTLVGTQVFGAVFAILLLLILMGGLVQGSLFPQFGGAGWFDLLFRPSDWARLMVWSFIAGFSERFVPDLLNNLILRSRDDERREAQAAEDDPQPGPTEERR
ncbi:MAG TPA: hypothetical protein VFZ91_14025 [Allosphingosinicella sp.]